MQYIHHLVMTADKRLINPIRLRYVQFGGSYNVRPTLPVGNILSIDTREDHRYRAPWKVVGDGTASELYVEVSDRFLRMTIPMSDDIFGKPADGEDLCCAERTITEVHRVQSQVGAIHYCRVRPLEQDGECVGRLPISPGGLHRG